MCAGKNGETYNIRSLNLLIMKTRRKLYFLVGVLLIIANLLLDIIQFFDDKEFAERMFSNIGYFIGSNIFLIFGLILIRMGYKHQKKIRQHMENLETKRKIDSIGKQ